MGVARLIAENELLQSLQKWAVFGRFLPNPAFSINRTLFHKFFFPLFHCSNDRFIKIVPTFQSTKYLASKFIWFVNAYISGTIKNEWMSVGTASSTCSMKNICWTWRALKFPIASFYFGNFIATVPLATNN